MHCTNVDIEVALVHLAPDLIPYLLELGPVSFGLDVFQHVVESQHIRLALHEIDQLVKITGVGLGLQELIDVTAIRLPVQGICHGLFVGFLLQGFVHVLDGRLGLEDGLQVREVFLEGADLHALGQLAVELVELALH